MLGSSRLTLVLGSAPANTSSTDVLKSYVRALADAGLATLFIQPGTKIPADYRSAQAKKKAAEEGDDRAGLYLATTDRATLARYVTAARKADPDAALNFAIHPGRSRVIVIDADTPEEVAAWKGWWSEATDTDMDGVPPTVSTPGAQDADGVWRHQSGGHWYLSLPDGYVAQPDAPAKRTVKHGGSQFTAYIGDCYVLIPPSTRPEGRYEMTGTDYPAPQGILDLLVPTERPAKKDRAPEARSVDPEPERDSEGVSLEEWLENTPWGDILEEWTPASLDKCGCQTWTAPGVHDSPKSAVTHECGDHFDGGRLHVWTDNPSTGTALDDEVAAGRRDFSKLQAGAFLYFDGDITAAMEAAGIDRGSVASGGAGVEWTLDEKTGEMVPEKKSRREDPAGISPDDWDDGTGLADEDQVSDRPFGFAPISAYWDLVPPEFLVAETIQDRALTAIIGQSGVGKSFVALDMICSIVAGLKWQGRDTLQRRVLYVAGEGVAGAIQRVKAWVSLYGHEAEIQANLFVIPSALALHDWRVEQWRNLRDEILSADVGLVVLDTWARVTAGMEENSSKEVGHVIKHLDRMKDRTGAGMMVVHHTTRGTTHGRGSTALLGALDSEVLVSPGADGTIDVMTTKQKNGPEWEAPMSFSLAPAAGSAVLADTDGLVEPSRPADHFYRTESTEETRAQIVVRIFDVTEGRHTLGVTEANLRTLLKRPDHAIPTPVWNTMVGEALTEAIDQGLVCRSIDSGPYYPGSRLERDAYARQHHLMD